MERGMDHAQTVSNERRPEFAISRMAATPIFRRLLDDRRMDPGHTVTFLTAYDPGLIGWRQPPDGATLLQQLLGLILTKHLGGFATNLLTHPLSRVSVHICCRYGLCIAAIIYAVVVGSRTSTALIHTKH